MSDWRNKEGSLRRDAEQVQKLEDLGYQWAKRYSWEERFQQLKEFKEEHGHCNVPRMHPEGLGSWVIYQRYGGGSQRRNAEQTQKLKDLGFELGNPPRSWESRFRELKGFTKKHGHCKVPRKHPGGLGRWVEYQRSRKGSRCRNANQTQNLEELGLKLQEGFKDDGLSKTAVGNRVAAAAEDNADSMKPSSPMTQEDDEQEPNTCALPARSVGESVMVEQTQRQMQAAAMRGDYILAGKLQETLTRAITLQYEMQQAAQQNDFILAGHLQTQLNAFAGSISKKKATGMMFSGHEGHLESGDLWI